MLAREKGDKSRRKESVNSDAPFDRNFPGSENPWVLRPNKLTVRPVSCDPGRRQPSFRDLTRDTDQTLQPDLSHRELAGSRHYLADLTCPEPSTDSLSLDGGRDYRPLAEEELPENLDRDVGEIVRTSVSRSQSEKLAPTAPGHHHQLPARTASFQVGQERSRAVQRCGSRVTVTVGEEAKLIKINSLGVVTVPVPYPLHHNQPADVLWV